MKTLTTVALLGAAWVAGCAATATLPRGGDAVFLGPGMRAEGRVAVQASIHGNLRLENRGPGRVDWGVLISKDGRSDSRHGVLGPPKSGETTVADIPVGGWNRAECLVVLETPVGEGAEVGCGVTGTGGARIAWDLRPAATPTPGE